MLVNKIGIGNNWTRYLVGHKHACFYNGGLADADRVGVDSRCLGRIRAVGGVPNYANACHVLDTYL